MGERMCVAGLAFAKEKWRVSQVFTVLRSSQVFRSLDVCWGEGAWLYRWVARQLILPTWNSRQSGTLKQCSIICKRKLPSTIFPFLFLLSSVFPPPFLCCAFLRNSQDWYDSRAVILFNKKKKSHFYSRYFNRVPLRMYCWLKYWHEGLSLSWAQELRSQEMGCCIAKEPCVTQYLLIGGIITAIMTRLA